MTKRYTEKEIEDILKENELLKRDNKYLRRMIESKRFKFADKIANGYNIVFPKETLRRKTVERVAEKRRRARQQARHRKILRTSKKISRMAEPFGKVIVINSILWDVSLKQRPHHLAREFSELGFFVIYLESDNPVHSMRVINENLITINSHEFLEKLERIPKKYFLTTNCNPKDDLKTLKMIKDRFGFEIVYDYIDEFHEDISGNLNLQMEIWDNLRDLNPVLCIATAKVLYDGIAKHLGSGFEVILEPNAVDVSHFDFRQKKTVPMDLKPILKQGRPIVGFYGALALWIDFSLIHKMARKHPEWNFVFLGVDYGGAMKELQAGSNIYNLGAKDYMNLPNYAHQFDCAIIPFKHGKIAKATSPVKLFEYMAAGLPTVCTRDLQECDGYKYVYMAQNDEMFEEMLREAIGVHKQKKVREELLRQAEQNTWAQRAKDIAEALERSGR